MPTGEVGSMARARVCRARNRRTLRHHAHARLSDGGAAEAALRPLSEAAAGGGAALREHPMLRHNRCVFNAGAGALQVGLGRRRLRQEAVASLRASRPAAALRWAATPLASLICASMRMPVLRTC